MSELTGRIANLTPKQRALLELRRSDSTNPARNTAEPIAVIGIGCRFPGGVTGPDSFWRLLYDGIDAITEVPKDRWDIDAYYDPDPDAPGKMYTRWGGFVDNIDRFDPRFFGIAPREAASMDPQQRLLLEVAWEALEHAGQPPDALNGTRTGVFTGMMTNDYSMLNMASYDPALVDVYSGSGVDHSFAAGRLSYVLGVQGPSMVVATACSSALVATHLACQSLRAGECHLALAGGVNAILTPEATIYSCRIHSMAANGRCKTFDASADGYVRGEGCGVVVLKRLSDAVRDGDRILTLIRGSAINHDGRSAGLTVPNAAAQQAVIRSALASGGVSPQQVGYVEAHGTGTPLGDPIEVRSVWSVLGPGRTRPLMLGSAKTNIGHLEAAAGIAGLIKTILALQHRQVPPHLHLAERNPYIDWAKMQIEIPQEPVEWVAGDGPRIAGVSSFGLSGMNAHVILEEAPQQKQAAAAGTGPYLLPISARSQGALDALAQSYAAVLSDPAVSIADICFTASLRRSHLEERAAAVGSCAEELRGALDAPRKARITPGQRPKVVFVFPGQGGQSVGMGRALLTQEPVFRETIEACGAALRSFVDWSLTDLLTSTSDDWLGQIDRVQPAIFGVQIALAALWRSWGIAPDCVLGHSMGEVAAAHVAGVLSLEHAAQVICRRSELLKDVRSRGAMFMVELPAEDTEAAIAKIESLSIAASNGPRSTVVAGEEQALSELVADLERRNVFCRRVQVNIAAHTAQVDVLTPRLASALANIEPDAGSVPFYSTVYGALYPGDRCDANYWMANLRQRVQLWKALQRVVADGYRLFVELSPHPVLMSSIDDGLKALHVEGEVRPSLRRGEEDRRVMLETLGGLYTQGQIVNWRRLYPEGGRHVSLPAYPWQRERFWLDTSRARPAGTGPRSVLGNRREFSGQPGTYMWDLDLSRETCPYLADHRVEGLVVVPAAAYIAFALKAAESVFGESVRALEDIIFKQILVLPDEGAPNVQLTVARNTFQVASRTGSAANWTVHATGRIRTEARAAGPIASVPLDAVQARCQESLAGEAYYEALAESGLEYGPAFRGIQNLRRRDGESLARLQQTPAAIADREKYGVHPALLDACFQALGAAIATVDGPALPVGIDRLELADLHAGSLWCYTRMTGALEGEVSLVDERGEVLLRAEGFRIQSLEPKSSGSDEIAGWMYTIEWQRSERAEPEPAADGGAWLILADIKGLGKALAADLEARGEHAILASRGSVAEKPCRGVVYTAGLDDPAPMAVVDLLHTLANSGWRDMPRLYLVTSGAVSTESTDLADALDQAPLWGLGRTIALEHPEFACTRIDVQPGDIPGAARALCDEVLANDAEDQVAFRSGSRYVARLVRSTPQAPAEVLSAAGERPFRLEIDTPGVLENLTLRAFERQPAGPGEVEIEVRAAGLNFLDVLSAMGIRPDNVVGPIALGGECAGIVTAIGSEVPELKIGDPVIAIAPYCFGTHVRTKAVLAVQKPESLSFAEAAAIPVASLTAYYALVHLGRLSRGERILIHSASGGTGLAAVHIAQRIGAEVFATAGTHEKREFLRTLGIQHVMDSRSLDFAGEIQKITGGRGVDAVLNSLTGEAIAANLSVLAPYGRFLEIGKRDIYQDNQLGLRPFHRNLSYFAIDLARMIVERTEFVRGMLSELVGKYADGSLGPLVVESRPIGDRVAAFHSMAQAKHVGKIVLTMEDRENTPIAPARTQTVAMRADGSYLITGGLGGLGQVLAEWLVDRGARHLVLVGRSAPGEAAQAMIANLRARGAEIVVAQADIAQRDRLAAVLRQISDGMPPLRGIFHAAAVLSDSTLMRLDAERFERVMQPKIGGARNLHELIGEAPLDFFVLFSSAASVMGSPGQANYAAANAYLDALALYRRSQGKPALSINWGPWGEVGLAAAQANRGERLAAQGMASIPPRQGLTALGRLMAQDTAAQVAVMPFNLRHWRQLFPGATKAPFLAQLMRDSNLPDARRAPAPERARLLETPPALRQALLETLLVEMVARVLRMPPDQVDPNTPLPSLGLDSLMALELRNRLELSLGVTLSATVIFGYPTIGALAPFLADKMGVPFAKAAASGGGEEADVKEDSMRISDLLELSDDAAETLLAEKLAGLDIG